MRGATGSFCAASAIGQEYRGRESVGSRGAEKAVGRQGTGKRRGHLGGDPCRVWPPPRWPRSRERQRVRTSPWDSDRGSSRKPHFGEASVTKTPGTSPPGGRDVTNSAVPQPSHSRKQPCPPYGVKKDPTHRGSRRDSRWVICRCYGTYKRPIAAEPVGKPHGIRTFVEEGSRDREPRDRICASRPATEASRRGDGTRRETVPMRPFLSTPLALSTRSSHFRT